MPPGPDALEFPTSGVKILVQFKPGTHEIATRFEQQNMNKLSIALHNYLHCLTKVN